MTTPMVIGTHFSRYSCANGEQIVLFSCLHLYHRTPDSGERQCKTKDLEKVI